MPSVEEPWERRGRHDHDDDDDGFFRVTSIDACTTSPTIRLGTYVLANNETIKISETRRSGVRLVDFIGRRHIKHLPVGPGQAVITSTDARSHTKSITASGTIRGENPSRHPETRWVGTPRAIRTFDRFAPD